MSKAKQSQTRRNRRGVESIAIEHNEWGRVMLHASETGDDGLCSDCSGKEGDYDLGNT